MNTIKMSTDTRRLVTSLLPSTSSISSAKLTFLPCEAIVCCVDSSSCFGWRWWWRCARSRFRFAVNIRRRWRRALWWNGAWLTGSLSMWRSWRTNCKNTRTVTSATRTSQLSSREHWTRSRWPPAPFSHTSTRTHAWVQECLQLVDLLD